MCSATFCTTSLILGCAGKKTRRILRKREGRRTVYTRRNLAKQFPVEPHFVASQNRLSAGSPLPVKGPPSVASQNRLFAGSLLPVKRPPSVASQNRLSAGSPLPVKRPPSVASQNRLSAGSPLPVK